MNNQNKPNIFMVILFGIVIFIWAATIIPQTHGDEQVAEQKVQSKEEAYVTSVRGKVSELLQKHSTEGFDGDAERVLNRMYDILDEIITDDMLDENKVRAIHDYLVYHADYYEGNLDDRPGWTSAIQGVLEQGSGVCNSYALTFYAMCTAEGIECRIISGRATNSSGTDGHAWNRVLLSGAWYYIDCTWDDPTGGGAENYDYYLSPMLWADHEAEEEQNPGEESFETWKNYYLTGELW